ncbi:hypothetical protein AB0J83_26340 [Actinoplanes sp. NPDC049596]|uniref:hypothetical protein n=1 Tax=unclassified Actinoplanes TaxID=2626549 RepID=UPI003446CAE0
MTTPRETEQDEPNEFGFAGDGTAPEPERKPDEGFGESIAVPAGDLTGSIVEAIEEVAEGGRHRHEEDKNS